MKFTNCPFCGSNKITFYENGHIIECGNCPAGIQDFTANVDDLAEAWNRRVDDANSEIQEFDLVEIIAGEKRIGLHRQETRIARYRDTQTDNPKEEVLKWLQGLGIIPKGVIKIDGKEYALVTKKSIKLFWKK